MCNIKKKTTMAILYGKQPKARDIQFQARLIYNGVK